jgi:hypothetical protein
MTPRAQGCNPDYTGRRPALAAGWRWKAKAGLRASRWALFDDAPR